ncbi:MAG TPA: nitroreductase family protein [Acidimicrobiales bacterium]
MIEHLLAQRACREYTTEPVPDEDVAAILEAATHAPSAENRQPWVFVVVRDPATRAVITDLTKRLWATGGRPHAEQSLTPRFFAAVDGFMAGGYGGAPVLVVVAGDGRGGLPLPVLAASVFPAVQNLLLAAAALGYGSALTTLATAEPLTLAAAVGLPEGVRPLAVVPLGRPATPLGPPRRRPVREVAHRDRYGTPFPAVTDEGSGAAATPRPAPPPA